MTDEEEQTESSRFSLEDIHDRVTDGVDRLQERIPDGRGDETVQPSREAETADEGHFAGDSADESEMEPEELGQFEFRADDSDESETDGDTGTADADSESPEDETGSGESDESGQDAPEAVAADEGADIGGGTDVLDQLSTLSPGIFRENLLAKMFAGLVVILLFAGGTAGFFYLDMDSQLDDQVDTQIRETANLQSDIYASWFADREDELGSIAADARLSTGDRQVQSGFLSGQVDQFGFDTLHLVDVESGDVLASSNGDAVGQSLYDKVDGSQVSDSEFVTSEQYTSIGGDTVLGMGAPLSRAEGVVLVGEIEATDGGPTVRQTTEDSQTFVVNAAGEPVVGEESIGGGIIESDSNGTTVTSQGDWLYATTKLDNGLYMVTQTPAAEAFALSDSILQSFLVTLLVTFVVMSLVIGVGGRSIQKSITTLADRARTMEEGDLDVDLSTSRADEIGTLYGSFDAMRDSLKERIGQAEEALEDAEAARTQAESAREEAESARQQAQQVNDQIEDSADEYSEVMEAAANGDLTVRMQPNDENEAMAAIADDFNEMIAEFETVVDEVKQFAGEVSTASEDVTSSSQEVKTASEQVSEAIQEISEGAVEQNDSLQTVTSEMNDLSATVEEIAASSDEVAEVAARTAETGRQGSEAANDAIEGMRSVREESKQAVEEIEELEAQVEQVDELIARISDIAEQTSILALNANIEAARAGGSGSNTDGAGFSVVAQEVKKLSEDAKQAADEIEGRLSAIREQTASSAKAVQETSEGIEEQTASVENAAEALDEVAANADETNSGIQDISTATDEQADTTDQVVYMIDEVAEIAQQTTEQAETTTATAEEQTAAMAEVSENASELSIQATQLSDALDRFVTDGSQMAEEPQD